MPHDPQLEVASSLLSGHLDKVRQRGPAERSADIELAWNLAGELLRHRDAQTPRYDYSPPLPSSPPAAAPVKTKSRLVEREPAPLETLLAHRRERAAGAAPGTPAAGKSRTLH